MKVSINILSDLSFIARIIFAVIIPQQRDNHRYPMSIPKRIFITTWFSNNKKEKEKR